MHPEGYMFEQIIEQQNMDDALAHLLSGKDTCGTDGMYIHELPEYLHHNREQFIVSLKSGSWYPGLVRITDTVNRKGKQRSISSINAVDKLVARCIFQIIEPHLDSVFSDYSYAYRKERGVDAAVLQVREYVQNGNPYVVSADFEHFFDTIDHMILHSKLHRQFNDRKLESLILRFYAGRGSSGRKNNQDVKRHSSGFFIKPVIKQLLSE